MHFLIVFFRDINTNTVHNFVRLIVSCSRFPYNRCDFNSEKRALQSNDPTVTVKHRTESDNVQCTLKSALPWTYTIALFVSVKLFFSWRVSHLFEEIEQKNIYKKMQYLTQRSINCISVFSLATMALSENKYQWVNIEFL